MVYLLPLVWVMFAGVLAHSGGMVHSERVMDREEKRATWVYALIVMLPLILLTGDAADLHPLSVFLSKINAGDAGLAFSVATIYMVIPLLIFLYCEDYLVEGVSYSGGLKG